jgi:uncharacterized membrane protein
MTRSEHDANTAMDCRPGLHLVVDNTVKHKPPRFAWVRTVALLVAAVAAGLALSSLAGYASEKGWIDLAALDQLSKWVP